MRLTWGVSLLTLATLVLPLAAQGGGAGAATQRGGQAGQRGGRGAITVPVNPEDPAWVRANQEANNAGTRTGDIWVKDPDAASIAANARLPLPKINPADRRKVEFLLRSLAHDSMEGRATGMPGGERASRFIAEQMKLADLKPVGDSGYYQSVPLLKTGTRYRAVPANANPDTIPAAQRGWARNVLGMIPGTDPSLKDEVVIVLSHYDHLGMTSNASRPAGSQLTDTIYNGADDDASGTVTVLEVARHLKDSKPRRTILFATMTGEESGMIGTNYFIANPPVPLDKVVAALEIEMIGLADSLAGGPGKAWLTGYYRSTMGDMLKNNKIAIVADARPGQNFFSRSDNIALARRGIVAHTLSTFNLHPYYHQVTDEADRMDFDHMTMVISSAVEAVRHLANDPARPAWHPGGAPGRPGR